MMIPEKNHGNRIGDLGRVTYTGPTFTRPRSIVYQWIERILGKQPRGPSYSDTGLPTRGLG